MNNKYLLVAVALVLSFLGGYAVHSQKLGSVITPSAALDQQFLINDFNSVVSDLQALRTPFAGIVQTSTVVGASTLGSTASSSASVSTTITVNGALVGDGIIWGISTSTANVYYNAEVSAANTVVFWETNSGIVGQVVASTTFFVTLMPKASFLAPAALNTSTST